MYVKNIASNMTEVSTDKYTVLVSYSTPVAYCDESNGRCYRTSKKWSSATSKHINKWLDGRKAEEVDQSVLDSIM
jgi:hypothetical protein